MEEIKGIMPAHSFGENAVTLYRRITEIRDALPKDFPDRSQLDESLGSLQDKIAVPTCENMCGLWQMAREILDKIFQVDTEFGTKAFVILEFVDDD
jgi:hypothetical protein